MAPKFVRPHVRQMAGYMPGEQPSAGDRVIKLNTNENPFPPSPRVMQAIRDIEPEALRRYPNPTADVFRSTAAKSLGVSRDMILAGNGSDDLLTIATRTFVAGGGTLAFCEPTYSLYPILARLADAKAAAVPWEAGWSLPIDTLAASGADAIYLANPNAPSGTFVPPSEVARLAEAFEGLLLVDEAYVDFAADNCLPLVHRHANVIVTRSFSKAYSLAGLRFGYAVGQPQVIAEMMKVKDSYNCDAISALAAAAAMEDREYAARSWEHVRNERERMTVELRALGFDVLPSQANFILAGCPNGRGLAMYQGLKQQGILVRHFDQPGLSDKVRITIGTIQENNALLGGIKAMMASEKAA